MKAIRILTINDIHLGHNTNKTANIINNLNSFFHTHHKKISKVDMISINGDIWDKLLISYSQDHALVVAWLTQLVAYCSVHKIKLRILEGTPSHDWSQTKFLTEVVYNLKQEVDYKYINTLTIEKLDDLNLTILYVPDEYKPDATDTYNDVLKLMQDNHLTKVDVCMMHGAFNYQLPIELKSSHDEESYLNIVRYFIAIGHIHIPSVFSRIIAPGSFDRIAHNEEHDKGAMLFTIANGEFSYEFLVNKNAKLYVTYDYMDKTNVEDIIKDVELKLKGLEPSSGVRIRVNEDVFLKKSLRAISDKYKNYFITIEKKSIDTKNKENKVLLEEVEDTAFNITKDNVKFLLFKEIESNNTLTEKQIKIANEEFDRVYNLL